MGSEFEFKMWFCHFLALWSMPWATSLSSLLSFISLNYKMREMKPLQGDCEHYTSKWMAMFALSSCPAPPTR